MNEFRVNRKLMGSAFELVLVHKDKKKAIYFLEKGLDEIKRIETLLSEFKPDSFTSLINQNAGKKSIAINNEVFTLLQRSLQISDITNGAFDITVGPLKQLYRFKNEKFKLPSRKEINKVLQRVGYKKVKLSANPLAIFLKKEQMHISFAAIGKGYAADCVKKIWLAEGLTSGIINASGDLTTFGTRADGSPWKIGIAHPDNKDEILFYIPVNNAAVATSGDAEQFFIHKNTRFSHNINPKTGSPLKGLKSVSVFSPSAELSDALATAVYVMGIQKGLHFIDQLPDTHALIIDDKNEVSFSKSLILQHEK